MGYQTVKSVKKALQLMELIAEQSSLDAPLSLSQMSQATGILPVTARNLLRTLEECGYVRRSSHGKYCEGEQCARLFRVEGIFGRLREVARPLLEKTSRELNESLLLVTIMRSRRVELLRCQASDDRMLAPHWQANADFYAMRTTRVLLAWTPSARLETFLQENGLPSTDEWPECNATRAGLDAALRDIRRKGGCCDCHGDYRAISVPILTATNEGVASIGCYAPQRRTDTPRAAGIFAILQDCARVLEKRLQEEA